MGNSYIMRQGAYYPLGVSAVSDGVQFVWEAISEKPCEIGIFQEGRELFKIPVPVKYRTGQIYSVIVSGLPKEADGYCYYAGGKVLTDLYAGRVLGMNGYGRKKERIWSGFPEYGYDWGEDAPLEIPYENSVIYGLHVRGFTKHASSNVQNRGTFAGITEKIPYLKELGITAIELMPAYEFDEMIEEESAFLQEGETKINYWGYTPGYYFAPKSAYCAAKDPDIEVKDMVKALHQQGIEVILQFYFPESIKRFLIPEIIHFWVREYHIDGVHLLGENLPLSVLVEDSFLARTKLLAADWPLQGLTGAGKFPFRNLGCFQNNFMYDMRKFLKGDEDCLERMLYHMRHNADEAGIVNYMAFYNGFTLQDMVSYERKHNEENGENNGDGTDYNFSWNCGAEGRSRKKAVHALRRKQIRNALVFLLLAQGTPYIQSGDEFGQTQNGNNNPYCQDNRTTWLDWNLLEKNAGLFTFVKKLLSFRKEHPVFHKDKPLRMMDYLGCGYPDISYHGEDVWKAALENYNRHVGILYCGKYALKDRKNEDDYFYAAFNMYWEPRNFALPKLPKGLEWQLCLDTAKEEGFQEKASVAKPEAAAGEKPGTEEKPEWEKKSDFRQAATVVGRTVQLYQSIKKNETGDRK